MHIRAAPTAHAHHKGRIDGTARHLGRSLPPPLSGSHASFLDQPWLPVQHVWLLVWLLARPSLQLPACGAPAVLAAPLTAGGQWRPTPATVCTRNPTSVLLSGLMTPSFQHT